LHPRFHSLSYFGLRITYHYHYKRLSHFGFLTSTHFSPHKPQKPSGPVGAAARVLSAERLSCSRARLRCLAFSRPSRQIWPVRTGKADQHFARSTFAYTSCSPSN